MLTSAEKDDIEFQSLEVTKNNAPLLDGAGGKTPILLSITSNNSWDCFKSLYDKGANVYHVNNKGFNLLHLSVAYGRKRIINFLLESTKIDINAKNNAGETALDIFERSESKAN